MLRPSSPWRRMSHFTESGSAPTTRSRAPVASATAGQARSSTARPFRGSCAPDDRPVGENISTMRRPRTCAHRRGDPGGARRFGGRTQVQEGDWIALCATVSSGHGVAGRRGVRAARQLVDDDSEIVTVLVGADAAKETERIREHIEFTFPHLEVEFHDGGQPLYPYLVGVE